nr:MAG TPA: hypothetical protein [Bacteriophage sp.]
MGIFCLRINNKNKNFSKSVLLSTLPWLTDRGQQCSRKRRYNI